METKSNDVLVGAVAIALFIALFLFILWIARIDTSDRKEYDIFFQSVSGIATGGAVNYSGVPVGTVTAIKLLPETPEFVRVRIKIDGEVPILQGTTATIAGVGFTGLALVELDGAIKGAPPINEPGPFGVPVIPTKPGGLGQLLDSAPQLVERISTLTARLNELLGPKNQESFAGILANTNTVTGALASRSVEIAATISDARAAIRDIGAAAKSTSVLLDSEGKPMIADLRKALQRAESSLAEVEAASKAARGGIDTLNQQTLPEVNLLISDLRAISQSMGAIAAKLDEDPAGALVGGRTLPEYKPGSGGGNDQ
jgi:phospholipid/cholesterol/gamma-HCH transport system substrate-binding protein